MIAVDERQLPTGIRGRGWTCQTGAVLPVVVGSTVVERVAGGEPRGGGGYGSEGSFGLRWFPIEAEALGSSARTRGSEWWRWMGGGVSGYDEWHRKAAAAEPAGGGGDGLFRSIHD